MIVSIRFYFLLFTGALLLLFSGCKDNEVSRPSPPASISLTNGVYYHIDLNNQTDDKFHVIGYMSNLKTENQIFQFPAVVPGTYRISDMGRFVSNFRAYDSKNERIGNEQISINQWKIRNPEKLSYITYEVQDIWDTPVDSNYIFRMSGTSLEQDHALLNTFGILGYPTGLKERDYYISLDYPVEWGIGTALGEHSEGVYWADNYDNLVDSPILAGNITSSEVKVDDTAIDVFTYSRTGQITSSDLILEIESVIYDAKAFLIDLPVDRYSFLFHFDVLMMGALEHSYSSVYTLQELDLTPNYIKLIKSISAHEFFHIVTPLNIRSEVIQDFNFASPEPSAHLWLYEGVTEWASLIMQLRNNSMELEILLDELEEKINRSEEYDNDLSLEQLSLTSYTSEGRPQFANIYLRGAMTALLFDIRLLELSNGAFGLRELILDLINQYGPDRAFDEVDFFNTLVNLTYPEIADFIDRYINKSEPLPLSDYFSKIGIEYNAETNEFLIMDNLDSNQEALFNKWKVNF